MNGLALLMTGVGLLVLNGFFVMAEYGLVGARRGRIEASARKGNARDAQVLKALDRINDYVALTQICVTVIGIIIGSVVEEPLTLAIEKVVPPVVPHGVLAVVSIIAIVYPLVVLGELVPKYVALGYPESVARFVISVLRIMVTVFKPLIWFFEKSGSVCLAALRKVGLKETANDPNMVRDELFFILRAGEESGDLDESHSDMVAKALKLDKLDAEDAMIHRLDIKWLPVACSREEVIERLKDVPHSRIPVCKEDLDEVVGIVYLQDLVKAFAMDEPFDLASLARPPIFVPENLTLDRLVNLMREMKSQIVIVQDEYGGTSGLVTLEDVVEEIFGDLEDALEGERPAIERTGRNRLSVRPDVRYDELLDFLDLDEQDEESWTTEPVVGIMIDELGRTPKMGDTVDLPIGRLRVDAVAQRRVTRIGVYLRLRPEGDA